jgi:thymidylate synthase (FAD)
MFKVDNWKPGRPKFLTIEEKATMLSESPCSIYFRDLFTSREAVQQDYGALLSNLRESYEVSYANYTDNLDMGFDPGLARDCLPVGIYSSCWVSCNARSLMAFLSLRTHDPDAAKVSYPLYEIEVASRKVEALFAQQMPLTYKAFCDNGRQAP